MSDLNFQEAAQRLGISEAELEQLVAAGKISAIKQGDSLTFKESAIESYESAGGQSAGGQSAGGQSAGGGDDILLSDAELDILGGDDEIDFGIDIGGGDDAAADEPAPAAAEPAADLGGDLSLDDDLPEIDLGGGSDELDLGGGGGDETVLDLDDMLDGDSESTTPIPGGGLGAGGGGDDLDLDLGGGGLGGDLGDETLLDTDILDLGDDTDADTFELDTTEDTLIDPAEEGTLLRGGGARVMTMRKKKSHAGWTSVLAIGGLLMLIPLAVLLSTVRLDDLQMGDVVNSQDNAKQEWIHEYGEYFKGMIGSLADMFNK